MTVQSQIDHLPAQLRDAVTATLADWQATGKVARLWKSDASLWTGDDEAHWLGWLTVVGEQIAQLDKFKALAAEIKAAGFTHALLLGMGGSSLCPEVLKLTFGKQAGYPELHVLDSTDPAQVLAVEKSVDLAKTICIVSSKSGGTLEPNIFNAYFYDRIKAVVGADKVGQHFIAVTDPGSPFEKRATELKFRHIFHGVKSIGGRFSALSNFGIVPAAVMGLDVERFLRSAEKMVKACGPDVPAAENPGVVLGAILGVANKHGRDKVTLVASPGMYDLGAWLEQLLAESTGKVGKGIVPVDREKLGDPADYGTDRVFAYARLATSPDPRQDADLGQLERAGQPVVRLDVADIYDLGQEFFRWEIAVAVAGSIIGINTFNQPDVEASKIVTKELTSAYEKSGHLPPEEPILTDAGIKLYTDPKNAAALKAAAASPTLAGYVKAHLDRVKAGDYVALLGYIPMTAEHEKALEVSRLAIRDAKKVATCLEFGPRFLHSTGQAYKGGPNSGVFLQITCDDAADVPVPGAKYTFSVVKAAQARGDFSVLAERDRRALRIHLGPDVAAGLKAIEAAVKAALG